VSNLFYLPVLFFHHAYLPCLTCIFYMSCLLTYLSLTCIFLPVLFTYIRLSYLYFFTCLVYLLTFFLPVFFTCVLALANPTVAVKKQVFEILAAISVYSKDGYQRALQVLDKVKVSVKVIQRHKTCACCMERG
jgi:hypothetical protein